MRQVLTSPATGPLATAAAFVLAVGFGLAANDWEIRRARYEARIVELSRASEQAQAALRTQLASCHAANEARRLTEASYGASGKGSAGARQLLEQQPEGIDACARMESADQAVLSNLRK